MFVAVTVATDPAWLGRRTLCRDVTGPNAAQQVPPGDEWRAKGRAFFEELFAEGRRLDSTRLHTLAAHPQSDASWIELCDVVCTNRRAHSAPCAAAPLTLHPTPCSGPWPERAHRGEKNTALVEEE